MTDRPIIFSGPMVRALLDGRKTQTRRVLDNVPPQPATDCHPKHVQRHPAPYLDSYCGDRPSPTNPRGMSDWWCWWQVDDRACLPQFRVRYVPGDRLWVRESWQRACELDCNDQPAGELQTFYMADGEPFVRYLDPDTDQWRDGLKWRPSIHMPRWASRLTLIVEAVKVERLQDISEADAQAEGVEPIMEAPGVPRDDKHIIAFMQLWERLHGDGAWRSNPWVVAVTFRVVRANIDAVAP
jgi:hypothetical protein